MNSAVKKEGNADDTEYHGFLRRLQARFEHNTDNFKAPLFQVDCPDLWEHYLDCFTQLERQFHNCSACRKFIREAGSLVTIFPDGSQRTAFWDPEDAPPTYRLSVASVAQAVSCSRVIGPYKTDLPVVGFPFTGPWQHMALRVPSSAPFFHSSRVLTARQRMAEMREDFRAVSRALSEFSLNTLEQAVQLLQGDQLYRGEKVLGGAEWLLRLQSLYSVAKSSHRKQNLVWSAIGLAPPAFCHPRSGVIGTLLEDIESGLPFSDVAAKFKAKMHPLVYQRPQAPPKAGNIRATEKLVQQLGIEASLRRRYARIEELDKLWTSKPSAPEAPSLFGGILAKDAKPKQPPITPPAKVITWRKFSETVLPTADNITLLVPGVAAFAAYTTASDPLSPPILQWDQEEKRNPVDWYQFSGGSLPSQWGMAEGEWVQVLALSPLPPLWRGDYKHFGRGLLFVLEGCQAQESPGLCLFPESLRNELHPAKKTLEAYSKVNLLEDREQGTACGVLLQPNSAHVFPIIRVVTGVHVAQYKIDRWD